MRIIGQAVGMCAVALAVFIYVYNDKKKTLILKLISDLLWVLHFYMIGCYTATLTTAIAIIRELLLIKNIKSKAIVIVFPILFFMSLFVTYSSILSFIPPIASTFFTIGLWRKNIKRKEIGFSSLLMLIYGVLNFSYATVTNELFTMISLIIGSIKKRKSEKL